MWSNQYTLKRALLYTAVFAVFCAFVLAYPEFATFAGILPIAIIAFSFSSNRVQTLVLLTLFTTITLIWAFSLTGEHPSLDDGICATVGAMYGATVDRAGTLIRGWM